MLPKIKRIKELPHFLPQKWQTVILRNYGMVNSNILAEVLETDCDTIEREARRLNLSGIKYDPEFITRGYISIIRNNWHLLPYEQLFVLLQKSEAELEFSLKEDDFLGIKLGDYKPFCEKVIYSPLTEEEVIKTKKIACVIADAFISDYAKAFDFYSEKTVCVPSGKTNDAEKIVYSYSMLYGDALLEGGDILPEELLERLQNMGINGIWLQGLLSKLSPYPFIDGQDEGYELRRENLHTLIEKCGKYGIKVYLYINEPRGIHWDKVNEKTKDLHGRYYEPTDEYCLCTERPEIKEYLYSAVYSLVSAVPELGGLITITMSENPTNCFFREGNDCPVCGRMEKYQVVPEVNNIIYRAVRDAGVKTEVIANLWAWTDTNGWTESDLKKGVGALEKGISVLCVSEMGTVKNGDSEFEVTEYSISRPGPCEQTKYIYSLAKKAGRKIMAKVQINNSWEFSVVPYIPVFDLIIEHITRLKNQGVEGYMLSWTLGGYPTVSLDLAGKLLNDDFDYDDWLQSHFGDNAPLVKESVSRMSEAFRNYPYNITTLYCGPQQVGPGNLWYRQKTCLDATMVTYPFDDADGWCGTYSKEAFVKCLEKMLNLWEEGLDMISDVKGNEEFEQLKRYAKVFRLHFRSFLNSLNFIEAREKFDEASLGQIIENEKAFTKELYAIAGKDCRIGYEASNHYYYTQNTFLEKIICLESLL